MNDNWSVQDHWVAFPENQKFLLVDSVHMIGQLLKYSVISCK